MPRRIRLIFVGWGAIARRTAELLRAQAVPEIAIVGVGLRDLKVDLQGLPPGAVLINEPAALKKLGADIVVEAAARSAVEPWGMAALAHARAYAVSSTSAFCDSALLERLLTEAASNGSRVIVPSGALCGVDALSAASRLDLHEVVHTITKPPAAWRATPAEQMLDLYGLEERTIFFSGTAREVADRFPQNANAAIITALAGVGLDRTRVELAADPRASYNSHKIAAVGAFGLMETFIANKPLPENAKSSEITALSLVRLIQNEVGYLII